MGQSVLCTHRWDLAHVSSACPDTGTPPGFKTVDGATTQCQDGEYRSDWKVPAAAVSCDKCGDNIASTAAEQIALYDPTGGTVSALDVRASPASCCKYTRGLTWWFNQWPVAALGVLLPSPRCMLKLVLQALQTRKLLSGRGTLGSCVAATGRPWWICQHILVLTQLVLS